MLSTIGQAVTGAVLFFFTIAAISRVLTVKQGPGLVSGFGDALSNLFKNAGGY